MLGRHLRHLTGRNVGRVAQGALLPWQGGLLAGGPRRHRQLLSMVLSVLLLGHVRRLLLRELLLRMLMLMLMLLLLQMLVLLGRSGLPLLSLLGQVRAVGRQVALQKAPRSAAALMQTRLVHGAMPAQAACNL